MWNVFGKTLSVLVVLAATSGITACQKKVELTTDAPTVVSTPSKAYIFQVNYKKF